MTAPTADTSVRHRATARGPLWRHQRFRALLYQVLAAIVLLAIGSYVLSNTFANLEARSIRTGFGFLNREAGFRIGESPIAYKAADSYRRAFLVGVLTKRVDSRAMLVGMLTGVAALIWVWATAATGWTWYALVGSKVTFVVALAASFVLQSRVEAT